MYPRPRVVGGQGSVEFAGVGAQGVGESLGDPAWMGVRQRGMADRILGSRRSQLRQPGGFVAA